MTSTSTTDGFYKPRPGRDSPRTPSGSSPFIEGMIDGLKKDITREVFQEPPIISLLEKKKRAAEEQMKTKPNKSMWGVGTPITNNFLRDIIGEAYDIHTPKEKEKQVDEAVDKVAAERKEAKAREVFDTLDGLFEDMDYTGCTVAWTVEFDVGGKKYNYAAVLSGDGCWYITGKDTLGRKAEEFKAYMAEKALEAHCVEFRGTVL